MRLKRIIELLIGLGVGLSVLAPRLAPAQTPVVPGIYTTSNSNQVVGWSAISSTNPLPVSGSFSATLSGFTPASVYATPLSVSNSSSRVALPAGTVVAVYNTGTTAAYCQLGNSSVTATTSSDFIPGNSAIGFTVGSNVDLACITATGTTTVNLSGGSGLLTGFGGGGSSGGSNSAASATGSAVPANASYTGLNNGGNLIGWIGDSSGRGAVNLAAMGGTTINSGCVGALSGFSAAVPSTVCGVFGTYVINALSPGPNNSANSSPVVIANDQACTNPTHAFKHITTATDTLAVQGVSAQTVRLCAWTSRAAGTATWFWENTASTNANCSSSNTQIAGVRTEAINTGEVVMFPIGVTLNNTSGNGLCINSTGTGGVDLDYWYQQR